mmetsp:Transcript_2908/g.11059  ORF Transcript_2908/g.11059 Transcript_2908/m.11059 type:complete len:428 (-) Transcript_2908:528-1811(-)
MRKLLEAVVPPDELLPPEDGAGSGAGAKGSRGGASSSPARQQGPQPWHCLIVGSDYQERRLRRVFEVTPRLSVLRTVEERGLTWSFASAPYPPRALTATPADAFLARLHAAVDSLVPLLVNLHAVVNKEEFLARTYYDDLLAAKADLERRLELIESPMRPAALRGLATSASVSARELSSFADDPGTAALAQHHTASFSEGTTGTSSTRRGETPPSGDDAADAARGVQITARARGRRRRYDPADAESYSPPQSFSASPSSAPISGTPLAKALARQRGPSTTFRTNPNTGGPPLLVDEALEAVVALLGELERLIRPAAARTDSLTADEWRRALRVLQRAIHHARLATDPDRPLRAADWGRLLDQSDPRLLVEDSEYLAALADHDDLGHASSLWDDLAPGQVEADVSTLYAPPSSLRLNGARQGPPPGDA